jgi:cytochrome b6-f complex iron-sulfur subunit
MSIDGDSAGGGRNGAQLLDEQAARLDAFLDQLAADRQPATRGLTPQETAERMLAAQLRLTCAGVDEPRLEFLHALNQEVDRTLAQEQSRQHRTDVSRGRFLRRMAQAAAAAGLVGAGAAAEEVGRHLQAPQSLVAGAGRWYDIAGADELAGGQMKAFAAGGVLGYLVNDSGRLHAVSAVCTHMGCRLKPEVGRLRLRCPCHGAQFAADDQVLGRLAPDPLPRIDVRIEAGRVYARGTSEDV